MPKISEYHSLLPALNERCFTFRGPSWWIADSIQVRSLTEDEARLISENSPQGFAQRVEDGQKVMVVSNLPSGPYTSVKKGHSEQLRGIALSAQTTLNIVSYEGAICFPYSATISEAFIKRLRDIQEFEIWGDSLSIRKSTYRINPEITQPEVQEIYKMVNHAYVSTPGLRITMSRFCSSLIKSTPEDKLIDLTIALESIVPGGGEFRFRFPYFLSLIIRSEGDDRRNANKLLTNVYDARSALVHGADKDKKKMTIVLDSWNELEGYARRALFYRIHFESIGNNRDWKDHLLDLAYGANPLI
jgi:hypothetical protein